MRDALARFAGGLFFATCFAAAQAAPRVDVVFVNLNPLSPTDRPVSRPVASRVMVGLAIAQPVAASM